MEPTRSHIPALDGFRGIAVAMVLWGHLGIQVGLPTPPHGLHGFGVQMFFALSGFLITRILLYNRANGVGLWSFYKRRFLRIFPAFYLMLVGASLIADPADILHAATYTFNFLGRSGTPVTHTWSLAVEEHFYLVWPLIVLVLPVAVSIRAGIVLMTASFVGMIAFETWAMREGVAMGMAGGWTPFQLLPLLGGALVAYMESQLADRPLGLRVGLAALASAVVACELVQVFGITYGLGHELAAGALWNGLFATGLLLIVVSGQLPWLSEALSSRAITRLGKISYGVYLYHLPIFIAIGVTSPGFGLSTIKATVAVAATLLIAEFSYRYYELPIMRLGKHHDTTTDELAEIQLTSVPGATEAGSIFQRV